MPEIEEIEVANAEESAQMPNEATDVYESLAKYIEERVAEIGEHTFEVDEPFMERMLPLMDIFSRYFDGEVNGLEALPDEGPMLLVGNHSGGLMVPDTPVLIAAWYRTFGFSRPLLGLAFDAMFGVPGVESLMRKIGEIPASHENAGRALESGASLLVYPGGAREAFRPMRDRNRIVFSGHKGFIKLALRRQVPVVPVVSHGGHHTTVVLNRGDEMASRIGLDKFRLSVAPMLFQFPWGVSIPLLPGVPLPAKIVVDVGTPLDWSHHGHEAADDPEIVDACYEEITGTMQATLDRLARERPYPLLDRIVSLLPDWMRIDAPAADDAADDDGREVPRTNESTPESDRGEPS